MSQTVVNRKIYEAHGLKPFFGVFASCGVNYDKSCSNRHRDDKNIGYCAVMGMGEYDPADSGQLVLEELQLIFEIGPGDIIIFPSGLITHWNLELREGQCRSSFVAWSGGNLTSWADENCKKRAQKGPRPRRDPAESLAIFS